MISEGNKENIGEAQGNFGREEKDKSGVILEEKKKDKPKAISESKGFSRHDLRRKEFQTKAV